MYTTIIFNATVYNYYSSYITLFCQMSERTYSHPAVELSDHIYHSNRKKKTHIQLLENNKKAKQDSQVHDTEENFV
jgi:hypothetical protein